MPPHVHKKHPAGPLSDSIIVAVARLVDDSMVEPKREPTHSDIDFQIEQAGLKPGDPKAAGQPVGKAKRVRATLSWAVENDPEGGERLVARLIAHIRGCGGFRRSSPNYVGDHPIRDAVAAFRAEGFELSTDGELRPALLENLAGAQLTDALWSYVRRARRGVADAALVTGTGKDLLEATAAHVLVDRFGSYPETANFPGLLGQAFVAAGLAMPGEKEVPGEPAQRRVERALYEVGCAVNRLRNKEGTGHGRPWLTSVTDNEARAATELMGIIAERLLSGLERGR